LASSESPCERVAISQPARATTRIRFGQPTGVPGEGFDGYCGTYVFHCHNLEHRTRA
jgi:FtsP/CotA-like multicopper oxidase with cupredoxin domain